MLLTFFEPSNSSDDSITRSSAKFNVVMGCEIVILTYFIIDMSLRIQYMFIASKRLGFRNVFLDELLFLHFICEVMMIIDAVLFYSIYPGSYFRFGRIFRSVKAVLESREVYRTTLSVLY